MSMGIFLDIHLSAHQFIVIDAQGELFPRVFELFSKTSTSRLPGKKSVKKSFGNYKTSIFSRNIDMSI